MNLILILAIVIVAFVVLTKMKEMKHHFFYRTLAVILLFFAASAVYVGLKSGINVTTYDGFLELSKTYYSWLGNLFGNAKGVTGYAVKQNWGLNSTFTP